MELGARSETHEKDSGFSKETDRWSGSNSSANQMSLAPGTMGWSGNHRFLSERKAHCKLGTSSKGCCGWHSALLLLQGVGRLLLELSAVISCLG